MRKKRDKNLMASEVYEQKQKEMQDFHNDYVDWACSSAKWWTVRRPGKIRMEFSMNWRWFLFKAIIFIFIIGGKINGCHC